MRNLIGLNYILRRVLPLGHHFGPRFLVHLMVALIFIGSWALTSAQANTINVTGLGDTLANNGVCTIREAIINANNNAATWVDCTAGFGADVIKLPAGTVTLTIPNSPSSFSAEELSVKGDLDLTSSMTIDGNPAGTTINGGALDRIFDINPDPDGDPATPSPTIVVRINNLTMTNGRQNDSGGVRIFQKATVAMQSCTVSNSVSWANDAGGIFNGGTLTMSNCTVSGNSALLLAAGIKNEGGLLTLTSCTVTNNRTTGGTPTRGQGIGSYGTPVILRNTIVAANVAGRPDMEGSFESHGYNIIGRINDGVNNIATITPNPGTGDQIGINAALISLGPLLSNGGPTPTHALGVGSIAVDKGMGFGLSTDQRGQARPCDSAAIANSAGGDGADVGAFEAACKEDDCCCRRVRGRLIGTCCPKTVLLRPTRRQ